jgi:signal transduction histidine kinase/CheY-like chemotaxis protein
LLTAHPESKGSFADRAAAAAGDMAKAGSPTAAQHESPDALTAARGMLIAHRLPRFAAGWIGTTALWGGVLASEGAIGPLPALLVVALQTAVLLLALRLCRADRIGRGVPAVLVSACVLLGISSTVLFAVARASGDVLAFVLLTLYLSAALFFAWGWVAELLLWVVTVTAWVAAAPFLVFYVPAIELVTAILIGSLLSLAIAEGSARSFRAAWSHRAAEARTRRQLELARDTAEAATRAKDQFLATLSHELRSPLNAILAWTHLLRRGRIDGDRMEHALNVIERNARLQARLIEDLLDVSRIASGKLHVELEHVDLRQLIRSLAESARAAFEAKQVELAVELGTVPLPVHADPERLQQVLGNLLSNALKFTPTGGRVIVTARGAGPDVEVAVQDTGIGMTPEVLARVFERFHQADSSIGRRHGGLGLGLAIARHIVEVHGGTIAAESGGADRGSTFRLRLARASTGKVVTIRERTRAAAPFPSLVGLRVMVVDDEADARELVTALLAGCGATVTPAASVAEAMDAVRARVPDVLVADLAMPGEDGFTLIERVRSFEHGRGSRVRAIAITGLAGAEHRTRAMRAGFDLHLTKPVEPEQVVAAVAGMVSETAPPG